MNDKENIKRYPDRSNYVFTAIFAFTLSLLILFHIIQGYCLVKYKYAKDLWTAIGIYYINRISGKPLNAAEKMSLTITTVILLSLLVIAVIVLVKIQNKLRAIQKTKLIKKREASEKGSAEWAEINDLRQNGIIGEDGVIVGYKKTLQGINEIRLTQKTSFEHVAVIGPTGCGKTSTIFIPNLMVLPEDVSAIVTDPKGEIEKLTEKALKNRGYNIYKLNMIDDGETNVYNFLHLAKNEVEISELADITLRNGYSSLGQAGDTQWINFSQPLWEAALLAEKEMAQIEDRIPTINKAYEIIAEHTEKERAEIFKSIGGEAYKRYLVYAQSIQSPETSASIRSVLLSSLRTFTRKDVRRIIEGNDDNEINMIRPEELRKEKTVIFIQIPERKAELLKPISATLYWQILEHIIDIKGRPVFFFLDEFPNIGKIPGFAQIAATVRSRQISLIIGMQGIEQLTREYTKEEQIDILNNMKTKIFFSGVTGETGQYFTSIAGYSTIKWNEDYKERRELLTPDELRRIPQDKIVIVANNINPIMLDAIPYYKNKKYSREI
ncbi:MAG: type IV secretory system conjugative DNA transfer family protein [Thermovenabulum sp.]|uniref:type IV secretory system conjugative DNA transfer family protein n=1 Tax=Thermovenabulum sp. TaxID=3100335 RepID=UPI003C7CB052